jgi:hypothetical protein
MRLPFPITMATTSTACLWAQVRAEPLRLLTADTLPVRHDDHIEVIA